MPQGPIARPDLTVVVILDEFSELALSYEWRQIADFGPDDWQDVLAERRPDLLFVESAWRGNRGRWKYAMSKGAPSEPLRALVAWCRNEGIPTVFWNKEDPPNFSVFIETASLFDWVLTVDSDRLPDYRRILGHDRVGVMQFAAQPRIHNPIYVPERRTREVAFAGTYFSTKHPVRREQMSIVLEPARDFGLEIFSRQGGKDPRYKFPEQYRKHIVGSLPYERMLHAYKLYKIFLNVNSVVDSSTMCARRVFELAACGTPVISGFALGIKETFGDLVPLASTADETRAVLADLLSNDEQRDVVAHLAMREVFAKHTFGHRVDDLLNLLGLQRSTKSPSVSVVLVSNRPERLDHALQQVTQQQLRPLQLVLILNGIDVNRDAIRARCQDAGIDDLRIIDADESLNLGPCLNLGIDAAEGDIVAKMDDDDRYGSHYLADLIQAFSYTSAGIVGKRSCYMSLEASGTVALRFPGNEHRYVKAVVGPTITAYRELLKSYRFPDVRAGTDTELLRQCTADGVRIYSADRFNFIYVRQADPRNHTWRVDDDRLLRNAQVVSSGTVEKHVFL